MRKLHQGMNTGRQGYLQALVVCLPRWKWHPRPLYSMVLSLPSDIVHFALPSLNTPKEGIGKFAFWATFSACFPSIESWGSRVFLHSVLFYLDWCHFLVYLPMKFCVWFESTLCSKSHTHNYFSDLSLSRLIPDTLRISGCCCRTRISIPGHRFNQLEGPIT